jgi:hypothetical protein
MEGNTPALLCKAGVFHRLSNRELGLLSVCLEFFFGTSVLNHAWPRLGKAERGLAEKVLLQEELRHLLHLVVRVAAFQN